jgi:Sigma-70 factor, region 1.2
MQNASVTATGAASYLAEIRRFPMLKAEEEYMLAARWRERGDGSAAHRLLTSHLHLVAKIASASVAAMQARIKSLSGVDRSEICTATRLYFLEVVKARAVAALCKSGTERERDLGRFDVDVAHANEAIAARCL